MAMVLIVIDRTGNIMLCSNYSGMYYRHVGADGEFHEAIFR